ncbi:MAG: dephospho-CoA kinase [Actinomycetota bacterium]|nr:dephospho-CoA kinase [Actinomycetota bacterium]
MVVVGLTGGIGSGKSTVAAMLARRGAAVVDADVVAHEVVEPGGPAYGPVVDRFGPAVVRPDGSIDRERLAALVFADPGALSDLNAIVHPAVRAVMAERVEEMADQDRVVVLDIPLLVESRRSYPDLAGVVVVDCPVETAVWRLVEQRGMDEEAARVRLSAQASREERLAEADFVIDNAGPLDHLEAEVERCWAWIEGLRR